MIRIKTEFYCLDSAVPYGEFDAYHFCRKEAEYYGEFILSLYGKEHKKAHYIIRKLS